ncbi:hypothetical protein [Paenibacillus luteus]|uniref:hypothetical protein n=1 Tax=Paenibacillus luteus TaxID=2545753 RepID=UPI00114409A9|nr:hypothetical protein [Paenibacillus luteus]
MSLKSISQNRKYAFFSTLKSTSVTVILLIIIYYIGNHYLPVVLFEYSKHLKWLLVLYLAYSFYIDYSRLLDYLNQGDHIQIIKERSKYPIAKFKNAIGMNEVFLELCDKKIEFVKYTSPVPFIIFFWGLVISNNDLKMLTEKLPYIGLNINYKDGLVYLGYALFGIYLLLIRHYLYAYKIQYLKLQEYKNELQTYEEILLSIKETRRVDYEETIELILRNKPSPKNNDRISRYE